jgi:hypothetical protein
MTPTSPSSGNDNLARFKNVLRLELLKMRQKFSRPFRSDDELGEALEAWAEALLDEVTPPVALEHLQRSFREAMKRHVLSGQREWPLTAPEVSAAWLELVNGELRLEALRQTLAPCRTCGGRGLVLACPSGSQLDQWLACPTCAQRARLETK